MFIAYVTRHNNISDGFIMNFDIEELYRDGLKGEKAKFNEPHNTVELFACVELLFRNQPFNIGILDVYGRPGAFWTSVEFAIN